MADYNIYIHAIGNGTQTAFNPTIPWSQKGQEGASPTQPWQSNESSNIANSLMAVGSIAMNPDSIVGTAVSGASKYSAIIAVAAFVVGAVVNITGKVENYKALLSGDKVWVTHREDVQKGFQNLMRPISSEREAYYNKVLLTQQNEKRALESQLLGDSVINRYTGRGV